MIEEVKTTGPIGLRCKFAVPVKEGKMPLFVFLHGGGETGSNLELVLKYGPLDQLRDGVDIGPGKEWILVHPQNPTGHWTVDEIDEVIEFFKNNYPVDEDQIFLGGVSRGGFGVWNYAQSPKHVVKLAAILPICGEGNDPLKASVLVDEGIPGWAAHATNDTVVPYNTSKRMVDAVNNLAGKSQILFSSYGMWGHSAWSYFLRPEYGVYEWLSYQRLSHRVKKTPPPVVLSLKAGEQLIITAI